MIDPDVAQKEYVKRKESQRKLIKATDRGLLLDMLYQMVLGRRFEEKCAEVYRMGKIGGFCHLYIGQEAIAVGSMMALEPSDMVITAYRDHVQAMVKGMTPESVMAELYGKEGGCVKGKGGSMHMFSKEHEFYGGHGIVGGQIGVGTGMAYAAKYQKHRTSHALLLWRSRRQSGNFSRIAEHGPALETALHLHLRKQPVRNGHLAGTRDVYHAASLRKAMRLKWRTSLLTGWM